MFRARAARASSKSTRIQKKSTWITHDRSTWNPCTIHVESLYDPRGLLILVDFHVDIHAIIFNWEEMTKLVEQLGHVFSLALTLHECKRISYREMLTVKRISCIIMSSTLCSFRHENSVARVTWIFSRDRQHLALIETGETSSAEYKVLYTCIYEFTLRRYGCTTVAATSYFVKREIKRAAYVKPADALLYNPRYLHALCTKIRPCLKISASREPAVDQQPSLRSGHKCRRALPCVNFFTKNNNKGNGQFSIEHERFLFENCNFFNKMSSTWGMRSRLLKRSLKKVVKQLIHINNSRSYQQCRSVSGCAENRQVLLPPWRYPKVLLAGFTMIWCCNTTSYSSALTRYLFFYPVTSDATSTRVRLCESVFTSIDQGRRAWRAHQSVNNHSLNVFHPQRKEANSERSPSSQLVTRYKSSRDYSDFINKRPFIHACIIQSGSASDRSCERVRYPRPTKESPDPEKNSLASSPNVALSKGCDDENDDDDAGLRCRLYDALCTWREGNKITCPEREHYSTGTGRSRASDHILDVQQLISHSRTSMALRNIMPKSSPNNAELRLSSHFRGHEQPRCTYLIYYEHIVVDLLYHSLRILDRKASTCWPLGTRTLRRFSSESLDLLLVDARITKGTNKQSPGSGRHSRRRLSSRQKDRSRAYITRLSRRRCIRFYHPRSTGSDQKELIEKESPDGILPKVLKRALVLLLEITFLFNKCLALERFPKEWKKGNLIPIPKPDKDETLAKSYRPICLLSLLEKTFERLIIVRALAVIHKVGHASDSQFGFKVGRSTEDAIVKLLKVSEESNFNYTCAIPLDISGSFDNLWWPSLTNILRARGCSGNIFRVLKGYLHDREVIIQGTHQECSKKVTKGTPQGSIIFGSTAWNLQLDGLLNLIKEKESRL
ncbi:unnamed protein product [Trichogramma brassicae]|uniref:Reverse transcriptase domain-containing protein n=1 Tax=Trichogramma brassicae TaxID=86971 RepID=A0A6H5HWA5_9HYME|nr:unnamed protein product [Trichogramma brassicae]